jgi:hypothetical protein
MGLFDWVDDEDRAEVQQAWEEGQSGPVNGYSYDPMSGQYVPEAFDPGAALVELGGGHTAETVPDAVTPYATEDGGWTTKNLEAYLDGRFEDLEDSPGLGGGLFGWRKE